MDDGLARVSPDKERAKSMEKMAKKTLEMIQTIDESRFPSNLVEQYWHVVRELIAAVLLLDGYKTHGEGAHKKLIEYLGQNYRQFTGDEIALMNDLRITRNKIVYDGFFVIEDYLIRRKARILVVIGKLDALVEEKSR